ncbi:traU family protein [Escherichia coli]|nr:traU family protein [Escherichia coli]
MKRRLWLLMLFLFAGHVPAASADSACEGRFVNPITDICWSCIFPLSLGSIKVSQGKVPDTANPSMPIQICPAPPPLFRRIGLAIGYWEPMALTDVTRSPGCMVNLGFSLPAFGKTAQGTAKKDEKQVNGAFYHVHWYKYPLSLVKDGATDGVQIDPTLFSQYGIRTVPALVVFCSQGYDIIRGNLRVGQALEKVAATGDCRQVAHDLLAGKGDSGK